MSQVCTTALQPGQLNDALSHRKKERKKEISNSWPSCQNSWFGNSNTCCKIWQCRMNHLNLLFLDVAYQEGKCGRRKAFLEWFSEGGEKTLCCRYILRSCRWIRYIRWREIITDEWQIFDLSNWWFSVQFITREMMGVEKRLEEQHQILLWTCWVWKSPIRYLSGYVKLVVDYMHLTIMREFGNEEIDLGVTSIHLEAMKWNLWLLRLEETGLCYHI